MLFLGICSFLAISCTSDKDGKDFVKCVLKQGILERAAMNIKEEPVTVTAFIAERSAGDIHDFYSEGDYWWPRYFETLTDLMCVGMARPIRIIL